MSENIKTYPLVASCAAGLETLLMEEISSFGGITPEYQKGVVSWVGELRTAYQACLWSRFASRILLQVTEFRVDDEDSLYTGALAIDWCQHFDLETTFAVDATISGDSPVTHSRFAALRIKDAIVDQFREKTGQRPSVDTSHAGVRINLHVEHNRAILAIDLSGESLHRRGYRVSGSKAPLKETLAAAIVAYSGWRNNTYDLPALVDPMCGTGTLLIEAALMFGDSAPGLSRSYFGFMGWKKHQPVIWESLVEEALTREEAGSRKDWPFMIGYDSDPQTVSAARKNIVQAGLDDRIQIKRAELAFLRPPLGKGLLLSNLPYGERLSESGEVGQLYRCFGRIVRKHFVGWRVGVFISSPEMTDSFGLQWLERYRLFNGSLQCRLLVTSMEDTPSKPFRWEITQQPITGEGEEFGNRLRKNLKKMIKWAAKERVSCFRVYDRDLPDYNISVDLYGKWVHVQEYKPPKLVDPDQAAQRFQAALRMVRETLGVRADRVFIKTRMRQRGKKQYQKKSNRKKMLEVQEGECFFLVNFTDYIDTGLFLDHRPIRQKIFKEAAGKRFLNLFGYTGTATVHAAAGGAAATTTVDLSETYLQWARMNLALNGFDLINNTVVRSDCLQWLRQQSDKYDLVFVDPPTFSNTKKDKLVFDVQRDHSELIVLAMKRLEIDGVLVFSTNFRGFRLDNHLCEMFEVQDISRESIPYDYSRNPKVHKCWEFRKK